MYGKVLPRGSRDLLAALGALPAPPEGSALLGWVLAGGTGLALQLGHRLSEDFDFFVRLLASARLVHVEEKTFYLYRKHALQVTRTIDRLKARQASDGSLRRLFSYLSSRDVPGHVMLEMKRHEARARINLLREAAKTGREGVFEAILNAPESLEAIRFARQGMLPVKWQLRAAMLDMARVMKG